MTVPKILLIVGASTESLFFLEEFLFMRRIICVLWHRGSTSPLDDAAVVVDAVEAAAADDAVDAAVDAAVAVAVAKSAATC